MRDGHSRRESSLRKCSIVHRNVRKNDSKKQERNNAAGKYGGKTNQGKRPK